MISLIITIITITTFIGAVVDQELATVEINQEQVLGQEVQTTAVPLPTKTATPTPKPTPHKVTTYIDPDPIVNCGPGVISKQYVKVKSSQCKNYVDCGLNNNTTYNLILKTECDRLHAEENARVTNELRRDISPTLYTFPSYAPIPSHQATPTPVATDNTEYYELVKKHQEACQKVVAEWTSMKESFNANEYNNFSSSAEAIQVLEKRRQSYQQQMYSVGCTQTIHL